MSDLIRETAAALRDTVRDVLPIALVIVVFQVLVLRRSFHNVRRLLVGFIYVILGLALFLVGLGAALFPLGEAMARQLSAPELLALNTHALSDPLQPPWHAYGWLYLFAFTIALSTTIAEPALIAVALKASQVSAGAITVWGLRIAVALGVATGTALGTFRIVTGLPLAYFILAGYTIIVVQTYFAPRRIIPLAYDSGGVSTSTVTVPILAALGLGLAAQIPGRDPLVDGFGLIAFAVLFPIIAVMGYAQMAQWWVARGRALRSASASDAEAPESTPSALAAVALEVLPSETTPATADAPAATEPASAADAPAAANTPPAAEVPPASNPRADDAAPGS